MAMAMGRGLGSRYVFCRLFSTSSMFSQSEAAMSSAMGSVHGSKYVFRRLFSTTGACSESEATRKTNYKDMKTRVEELKQQLELRQLQSRIHQINVEEQLVKKQQVPNVQEVQKKLPMNHQTMSQAICFSADEKPLEELKSMGETNKVMEKMLSDLEKLQLAIVEQGLNQTHDIINGMEKKLKEELEAMTGEITDAVVNRLNPICEEMIAMQKKLSHVEQGLAPMSQTIGASEKKLEEGYEHMSGIINAMKSLLDGLEPMSADINSMEKKLSSVEHGLNPSQIINDMEKKLDQLLKPMSGTINAVEKKVGNVEQGLDPITSSISAMKKIIFDLEKKLLEESKAASKESANNLFDLKMKLFNMENQISMISGVIELSVIIVILFLVWKAICNLYDWFCG